MIWETAGQASVVFIPFKVEGEFVVPDAGSISVTIRNNAGVPITGYESLVLPDVTITTMPLAIPSLINTLDVASTFETRYVRVDYTYQTQPYFFDYKYRITPFLPIQKTGQDVRDLIGASFVELPDLAIDLTEAYFKLVSLLGASFVAALTAPNRQSICANNLIALQAALTVAPTMQTRLMKLEKSMEESYERSPINFVKLEADLNRQFQDELRDLEKELAGGTVTSTTPVIFTLSTPTDVITG